MKIIYLSLLISLLLQSPIVSAQLQSEPSTDPIPSPHLFFDHTRITVGFVPFQFIGNIANHVDIAAGLIVQKPLKNAKGFSQLLVSKSLSENMVYLLPSLNFIVRDRKSQQHSLGPMLLMGVGRDMYYKLKEIDGIYVEQYKQDTRFMIGFLLNYGFRFAVTQRATMALEYAWGVKYFDNYPPNPYLNQKNTDIRTAFQMNYSMSYRLR